MSADFANPRFLYRYRSLRADGNRHTETVIHDELELIRKGLIWLSTPNELNDPFDCRPACSAEQQPYLERLLQGYLVGSLSAVPPDAPEAITLWSHYANDHKGICIEFPFDKARAAVNLSVIKVSYTDLRLDVSGLIAERMRIASLPRIGVVALPGESTDPHNNIESEALNTKSKHWAHEQEWRFVWNQPYVRSPESVAEEERLYGPNSLRKAYVGQPSRVTLGANMSKERKIDLSRQLEALGVPCFEAARSATDRKIECTPIQMAPGPR